MSIWHDFASLIGVAPRHAEAALYSERAARATLSRRSLLSASAALATGIAFGFGSSEPKLVYYDTETFRRYPGIMASLTCFTALTYLNARAIDQSKKVAALAP